MKTVVELRNHLSEVFDQLSKGQIEIKEASEMTNVAGKMINSAKVQLEYHNLRKDKPKIKFLHVVEDVE
tara:strand:+ start:776 stop:982 length:207 start_codon:yes stop_codon:yes gene_type:complete